MGGNAGVDAGIVEAGIGLDIKLYAAKLPATLEFAIGGNAGANCLGFEINSESGSGRMYLYFDSWFTNRKEWDLFECMQSSPNSSTKNARSCRQRLHCGLLSRRQL